MKTYPLLQSQLGIFLEWMKDPSVTQYNLPTCTKLSKSIDLHRFTDGMQRIFQERSTLRTHFVVENDEPRQYVDEQMSLQIPLRCMTDQEAADYIDHEFVRPFDLLGGKPLVRAELIEAETCNWFLLDIHHSIADGVTLAPNLTLYDIPAAYNGSPLEPVEYGMYEYAVDEQAGFNTDNYKRAAQYYQEKFAGVDFVTLAGNPESHLGNMVRASAFMSVEDVDKWCQENGTSSNLLYMAAFSLVMSRLSRDRQVAYYSVNHGRMDKRLARAYGMFVKSVPILADVTPDEKVIDFIKGFRRELMSTIRYGVYPFNHFCRDMGVKPMVSFGFQGFAMQEYFELEGERCTAVQLPKGKIDDDMSCVIYQRNGQYDIRMESSDALNSRETLRTVADAVKGVTEYMMAHPDARLDEVELLTAEEQADVAATSQGKPMAAEADTTFPELFMAQAAKTPDATAVVDELGAYTYAQLDSLSGALSIRLRELGVGSADAASPFVSIMLGYEKAFLVAAIAIEKAGGAYVPLDYEYPNERLLYMLEDSESQMLITSHAILEEKSRGGDKFETRNMFFIDDFLASAPVPASAVNHARPDGLAYMIYTSGSTGKPKGVMIPHRAKANFVQFIAREWGHTEKSRICCHSSFSFDASIEDLYPVLTVGGTLYTVPKEARKDMDMLHDFIIKNGITGGCYTTQLGQMLLQLYPDLPVDYLVVGGEKMTAVPDCQCRLINTYGPTEFTVDATFFDVEKGKEYKNIPIGRPLYNLSAYVVDSAGHLLPQGMPGELCMAGPQMAAGYWKQESLTAEKFSEIPVAGKRVKVYHTGDLVRYNDDGQLEYLGRIDNQVKLRGFRIELGEIETLISKYDGMTMVSVQVKEVGGVQHLVAYYTSKTDIDKSALASYLAAELTDYMVPDVYMQLEQMPLTPNGKVNTKALPAPQIEGTEYIAPEGEKEILVADSISQLLNLSSKVGAQDSFFTLGGDSIKSIRLISMLRQKGLTLSVADVMKGNTVRGIAALAVMGETIAISQEEVEGEFQPGAIMRYFLNLQLPHAGHYNQSVAFESAQRLDTAALRAALDAIATHHDMLRLRVQDSHIYINKVGGQQYDFTEEDIKSPADLTSTCDALQRTINLSTGPILKVALFHAPDKDLVVMICHHLAVDGVSWRIIAEDLNLGYQQALDGKPITLPKKTHSYPYYAEAIARYRDSYALSKEKDYWTGIQKKMEKLPQGGNNGTAGQMQKLHTSYTNAIVRHLLTDAHRAYGTTENDLMVAALARSYRRLTGNSSVSILMEGHGREPIHEPLVTDRTVGWFTSTYPLVVENLNGDIRHDVRNVKETFRNVPNKGLGYGILQYIPSAEGDKNLRTDLTELLGLNYLGELNEDGNNAVLNINTKIDTGCMVNPEGVTGPAFMIDCSIANSTLQIEATYDSKSWTAQKADELVKTFCDELEAIVAHTTAVTNPELTASDLGATGWTDEQYEKLTAAFAARGERMERIYPLSPMQEGMLLEYMMNPDTTSYVLLDRFAMSVLPTEEQMRHVLNALAAKHEVFRTSILFNGISTPCQAIVSRPLGLRFVDISGEKDIMAASKRIHDDELHTGFNLQTDPLFRVVVMKTSESTCHILLCTHHIIVDGWCLPIYLSDFFTLLTRALKGDSLPQEEQQEKGRYEQAIRNMLSLDKKTSMNYWRKMVGDYCEKAVIPYSTDGMTTDNQGEVQAVSLSEAQLEQLKATAGTYGVTLNTIVELVWGLVLQTYNRSHDVVFGKVVSGRNRGDVADLVGLFINTVPVRVRTSDDTTIGEALRSLRQQASETSLHDYCPLSEIQQLSELGSNLYQSRLTFENYEGSDSLWSMAKRAGITVLESEEINFSDIHVTVGASDEGAVQFSFIYNGKLYSKDTISHVKNLFFHLLDEIASNADRKLSELSLLSAEEKALVTRMHSTAQADVPLKLHHQPIEKNAVEIPDTVALIAKDCTLTFRQFNEEANRIAHALMARGVRRGDRIVLLLPRTSAVIVAMFGVSKTGAAYIPCDPEYPADRINLIMTDSEAQYIITTKDHLSSYDAAKVIDIDDIYRNGAFSTGNPNVEMSPDDLAYLIYTSGSTGRPKGVMLRHRGITNYLYNHPANVHIDGLKRLGVKTYVSITTLSFDMSLKEFAGSLYNGITTVLADEEEVMDPSLLAELMTRTGAEAINGTCSRIQTYLEMPAFCEAVRHCKMVWSGGEMYPDTLLKKLQSLGVEIINTYGPTEITVSSNIANLTHASRVNVGHPLLNYVEYIVDPYDREVPVGVAGELLIGGPGVALGYNNLPELTAQRFVNYQGTRVYRSGDLARWESDGSVTILGRNDDQVKLRGFRVELGEIEAVAMRYEGIRQAVADIKEVGAMQHLCLYYVSDEEQDVEALKTFLGESLTEYMVPTAYIRIDHVPLTPNGKTNRKALPLPEIQPDEIVPPANDTEARLLELMRQQLNTDLLGVTTNLVTMGLSSIGAMRLSATLLQQHAVKIAVRDILEHPTVRQMASRAKAGSAVEYHPYPLRDTYPLSESQRGMLIDCLMNRDALQYNIPALLKYKTLDTDRLKRALSAVGDAHPYLKARIALHGDDYVQERHDDEEIELEEYTLDYEPDRAFFQAQIKPFNVDREKLYRFKLFTTPGHYYLVIDIHHLISDGSSNYILAREMEKAYSGQPLVKETYTAFDRAIDEDNIMQTERGADAEQYFDRLIADTEATVYPHSSDTDGEGVYGELLETIPSEAIDRFCKQHALAPSSFFLTAFHHVLHRITREDSTLLYFISNGRSEVQLENFFGVFVKTMPTVVSEFKSDIVSSVRNLHQQMLDTIAHDYYPFTKMVERHNLKAEILYNYFVDLQTNMSLDSDAVEAVPLEWDTAKTPLSITMLKDNEGNYVSSLEYDSRLYSRDDMLILNKAFHAFAVNSVMTNVPLSQIPIVAASQQAALMLLARGKTMTNDESLTFPALFMTQAAKTPSATAVVDEQGAYTYAQLNRLSGILALKLRELGVGAEAIASPFVSIMLGYEKAFLVAAIGVEKAGGAYVPLDYDYPTDRLLYMLDDSESQVLITSHAIFCEKNAQGEFNATNILFIDDFLSAITPNGNDDTDTANFARPDGLAYMIYTSGSTGKPKGVMIPHRAKANFVQFIAREWGHTEKSRICCHSSFSFDASIEDLYPVLTVGGTLYTVPKEARKDLVMLHDFIVDNGITGGCYTTQLGQMLLQLYPDLPVDYLVVGGEKMTANPDCQCRLINTYGPTEFTVDATFFDVEKGREYKNIPIGRPLYNLSAFVVDAEGQLTPQGIAGELCMAGPQIADGYWKREELTAEKFTDCPFADGKMYHTGDLVRYNADGDIEYLGRIDNQVKLRGFRIELGEIETLIGKYEGIQMESVQVREIGGVQHLCAYYTADRKIDQDALRDYLAEELTDYMVPTAYMQLDEMPLTPNGKVNTKALPTPNVETEELVAPVTKTEKALFKIAAEMLKHDNFGITNNLIAMGLTSLTAMRFTVAAYNELGIQISVKEVMQNSSIHQLAALIDSKREEEGLNAEAVTTEIWPQGKHYYYPITENQRGVFFDWEMNRDTTQYNVPDVVVMIDADVAKLRDALEKVVNAHPYLKTHFVQYNGDVVQIRRDHEPVEILMESLTEEPDTAFFQNRVRPFDLYNDQLYRLEIYSYSNKVYLFIDIHHSIYDGASSLILLNDIQKAYEGELIEPETYTAFEFALDELKLMRSKEYDEAGNYFEKLMGSANTVVYPHSVRKEENDPGILSVHFKGNDIDSFCQQNGLTLNSYFLAVTMHVLHTVTREDDIIITTINNGRSDVRMMNIMGMFVKTIPVVSSIADSTKSVVQFVKLLQNQLLETQSRDFYPFTKMVELYGLRPEIMYAYQPRDVSEADDQEDKMRLLLNQTKLPLDIQVMPEKDGFVLELQYDTALYSKKDMQQLAQVMTNMAEQAPSKPSLKDIPLLSDEDTEKVLRMSTGKTLDYDHSVTWVDMFKQQAKAHPDQTAVVDSTSQLTYRELDEKSDSLAHWLVSQGVKPNDFVAVKMDRVKEFMVAVLAIQKAGAAYVPIDKDYPEDRIGYMIENSEAKVLVTEKTLEAVKPAGPFKSLAMPDSRAYMIYTSGSTGRPKGVIVAQRGLTNLVTWIRDLVKLKAGDRTAIFVSFSFDASVNDLYPILTVGGELHIFSSEIRKDMESMYKYLCEHHIKGLEFTTQLAMAMMQQYQLPIEYLFVGGEKLKPFPPTGYDVINVYGPTEFTDISSYHVVDQTNRIENIPIGKPVPNTMSLIVDPYGRLLPQGFEGELCLSGRQMTYGYWKQEKLTEEKFVDCPFSEGKMYRTGDISRYNDEGNLEYVGRIDTQVKLNGFRIELGGIENRASMYKGILQVAAEVSGGKLLCLYYTATQQIDEEDLKAFLGKTLAEYMVPSVYIQLDAMPMTPNGKVDHKKLPAPKVDTGEIVEADSQVEADILAIAKELLGGASIGVTTNLISAGMTSLTAMRMSAVIKQQTGFYIPVKDIMLHPTIREMAALTGVPQKEESKTHPKQDYYPITENQRGVYIDWELNRNTTQYNLPSVVKFPHADGQALRTALISVVEAHPYLKTRLAMIKDDVVQLRLDDEPAVVELTVLPEVPTREFFVGRVRPFDLFHDRLYRMEVYQTPAGVYYFQDIHHIVFDGASDYVLRGELERALRGERLQAETYTAFDRALDEADMQKSEQWQKAEQYFDSLLEDVEMTPYPHSSKPDGDERSNNGYVEVSFDKTQIDQYSRKRAVTANSFLLTVLMQVLHRLTREERIAIATISSGRSDLRLHSIVGMFVKTLPVVSRLDKDGTFADALQTMSRQSAETQGYDIYPFTRMAERYALRPEIMFVFQGGLTTPVVTSSEDAVPLDLDTTKMPVAIMVNETEDGQYNVQIEYDTHLYAKADMRLLAEALRAFALQVLEGADSLRDIALAGPEAQRRIIELSRGEQLAYDENETFVDMLCRHAEAMPDATAVVDQTSRMTYGQLHMLSNTLAKRLMAEGVGQDDFVAVMLPRRKEFITALLGIMKAGAAYVPMDSEYPTDRLQYMLEDCRARVLLTTHAILEAKQREGDFGAERVIYMDEELEPTAQTVNLARPEGLAYMIYTSGSTGKPKGVMLPHRALRAFLAWHIVKVGLTAESRNAEHASFSFDASLDDLLCPLAAGGRLYILPEELRKDMDGMCDYLRRHRITGMTLSTALGMALLGQFSDLPLEYILMGGEKMLPFPKTSVRVINGYGPTEFTVCSSVHVVDQDRDGDIPIGRPVPNSYSFVCDAFGQLLPQGAAGELCLSGVQMARGYWQRDELTREKFCDTPFGHKVYRTGDLCRWNEQGELEFLGRIDSQVKLRGFRIELGEIEHQAQLIEGMRAVAAEVREVGGSRHLVLYFAATQAMDADTIREQLAQTLTAYMVPDTYMQLDEMPMTPNGKVNRRALPQPVVRSTAEFVEPRTEAERIVARAMQEVLGLKQQVGAMDSFFAWGGDSIKSIRLVSRLRAEGITLQVADVMRLKTVGEIAAAGSKETVEVSQDAWSGEVEPTAITRFFFDLGLPKPYHFNQTMFVRASQRLQPEALNRAVAALVDHHDMLRAVVRGERLYVRGTGEPDLYGWEQTDYTQDADYARHIGDECWARQKSINLSSGPLFKVTLFNTPEYDALLMVCHHLVCDGVSWRILLEDFGTAYGQAAAGEPIVLPAKTHSYREYATRQQAYAQSYELALEEPYWQQVQERLMSLPSSAAKDSSRFMKQVSGTLDEQTTLSITTTAGEAYHADINDLLMTALGRSYYQLTGEKAVSVQFEGHGREPMGTADTLLTDRTVGWFTSVYPIVLEHLDGEMRDSLRLTKETMHRIPNKGLGYNILRFQNGYLTDRCARIGFNYLGEMTAEAGGSSIFTAETEISAGADFSPKNVFGPDIAINCAVNDGRLEATLAYNVARYTQQQARQLLDGMMAQLKDIAAHTAGMEQPEVTATDLGEYEWTDEEFQQVYTHFMDMGTPLQRIYPLSPMQEGIVLKFMLETDSLAYRLVSRMALDILPTEAQLRYALTQLAAKHEVLRTSIIYRDVEQYRQAIVDRPLGLEMRDITGAENKENAMTAMYKAEQQRGFDMEDQALFRIVCVKTSETTCEMLLAVHHIIVDGWCIGLFMQDLIANLADAVQGRTKPIGQQPAGRYERFIRELARRDIDKGLDYWKRLLEGYTTKAVIPSAGIVPERERTTDNVCSITIDGKDMIALNALSASTQATMNTIVELAWGILLQIYNRQDDAVFVKIVSGRNNASESVEDVVGLFINAVPVRVRTPKGTTVLQALGALQQQAAESNEWDFCPLSAIQQQTALGADLFQSIVAFENYDSGSARDEAEAPFHVKMLYAKEESVNDLTMTAYTDGDKKLTVNLEFDPAKYRKAEIAQVMSVMRHILIIIASQPQLDITTIPPLNRQETVGLAKLGLGETMNYDMTQTLVDLFTEQARRTPDSTCIVFKDKRLTFREVDDITTRLAILLQQQYDVRPEEAVGVMIDRSELMLLYPMAIMKAGAAYMPLDFHFPTERLAFMCKDAAVRLILSEDSRVAEAMPDYKGLVLNSDVMERIDDVEGTLNPNFKARPDNMFVILYTSGSTGTPKGVVLEHRNIVNFCHWYVKEFDVTQDDRAVAYANFGFDAHMMDIYPVTAVGGSVYIIPSDMRMDLMAMNEYMERERLNLAFMTTQVGYMFATTIENHSLRLLSVGGEKLQPLKKPPFRFYNGYGPTECTLYSTCYNIDRDYDSSYIGRPLAGYQLYVVDQNLNLVPRGAAGELIVAGLGVGRGYLNRPEQTAEKFITFMGQKAYRTGDLVRWSPDGNIDFIGRIDGQVKLRGLRIELGEIEARVSKYPQVTSTAVDVKELSGAQHICCYFTADVPIDVDSLKEYLSRKLTDYMVPTAYMQMEKMPLTPNGKVNRRALPLPTIRLNTENVAPETEKEKTLYDIAADLLKIEQFGVTDDLTKLGLTSLLAIKLVMMASKKDINIKLADLMKFKSIRATLQGNMAILSWTKPYEDGKSVVVVSCGATPYKDMEPYIELLSKEYAVLVFEPISEHYDYIFKDDDINEVIEMYYALLDLTLPVGAKICAFTGHCFGGEIAYRLAIKWAQTTGEQVPMIMLDVFWRVDPLQFDEAALLKLLPQQLIDKYGNAIHSYAKSMHMYDKLGRQGVPPIHAGDVVLFRATEVEPESPIMDEIYAAAPKFKEAWKDVISERSMDNASFWRQYYPGMEIHDMPAHHMSMLEKQHVTAYVEWLDNYLRSHHNDK